MTTTRWWLCVTMFYIFNSTVIDWTCYRYILHLQQYSHRLKLVIDIFYIFNSTVIDWTCYRYILHLQQYSHRLSLLYFFISGCMCVRWSNSAPKGRILIKTDISVFLYSIATYCEVDGPTTKTLWADNFCTRPYRSWEQHRLLCNRHWFSFTGVKQPGRGLDHTPLLAPRLKKEWSYNITTPVGLHGLL